MSVKNWTPQLRSRVENKNKKRHHLTITAQACTKISITLRTTLKKNVGAMQTAFKLMYSLWTVLTQVKHDEWCLFSLILRAAALSPFWLMQTSVATLSCWYLQSGIRCGSKLILSIWKVVQNQSSDTIYNVGNARDSYAHCKTQKIILNRLKCSKRNE